MKHSSGRAKRYILPILCALSAVGLLSGCQVSAPVFEVWSGTDERELQVGVDTCNREPEVTALETATEVRLSVRVNRSFALTKNDCLDGAMVTLKEPLGDRQVVDDSTGVQLTVQKAG
ncbi:MAG: hypothetical protein M3424_01890 [Actinomycetota bacterium]|nr:hypothetical protein [Actinomycetota bacterium]